ncbi:MAG: hypothetical protein EXS08_16870 [Planctomycetes bacterium]|nr:hypothetical protein [Planctomycetota bacterium]
MLTLTLALLALQEATPALSPVATLRAVAGARILGGKALATDTLTDAEGRFSYAVLPGTPQLLASAKGHRATRACMVRGRARAEQARARAGA